MGQKRNLACEQARGKFIVHWDDDDWYPPDRVARQLGPLLSGEADISGSSALYFWDAAGRRSWLYRYVGGARKWVAGNTLAYARAFWQRTPFGNLAVGEDSRFVWADRNARVCDLADPNLCVARIHPGNTSPKVPRGFCWRPVSMSEMDRAFGRARPELQSADLGWSQSLPLISCIMPTGGRKPFVQLALDCFRQQDYPRRELIIADDGSQDLSDLIDGDPAVRLIKLPARQSVGAKRNLACQAACGEIIAHWDDDDWHGPRRLSAQVEPLARRQTDMTGLECRYIFETGSGEFWSVAPALHQRMFVGNVIGGSVVYRKSIFDQGIRYPNACLAEDAALLRSATQKGHRLARISNEGLYVYVRHGANTWAFASGRFLNPSDWIRADCPPDFASKISLYRQCAEELQKGSALVAR